ncbi:MAG: FG-GAP repeat domain-containing protein, partial [Planctomycetota bacterium]
GTLLPAAEGKICGLQAVELPGRSTPGLFVQSAAGDRFYEASEAGEFRDLTDELKLKTRSKAAAWGDFDGDGLLDLASWDGKELTFCRMTETGTLAPEPIELAIDDVVSLTVAGAGKASRLVAATPEGPVLASRGGDGNWSAQRLGEASLDKPGPAAVADVTGDGIADIVQIFAREVLLARGTGDGSFSDAKPAWASPAGAEDRVLVSDPADLLTGDYDADGLTDLLLVGRGPGDVQLLRNTGGQFLSAVTEAGEVTYNTGESRPSGAVAWDVNNDGREEFLITIATDPPLPFFNRGFRTFGYARTLELAGSGLPPGAQAINSGQQAGVAADFDGDGMQEVALAAADGKLVILRLALNAGRGLALRVALPSGSAREVSVTAFERQRCLGVKTAAPGTPARFGKRRKGPLLLKWINPAGQEQSKQVIVLKPTRIELPTAE